MTTEEELRKIKEDKFRMGGPKKKKRTKAEKEEIRKLKARLDKAQGIHKPPKKTRPSSKKESEKWRKKRNKRYHDRVWRGWREKE